MTRRYPLGVFARAFRAGLWLAAAALPARAQSPAPIHIYLANDDHTDYFWAGDNALNADENAYRQVWLSTLDFQLDLNDATAGRPAPYRNRYNLDCALWAYNYQQHKPAADFQRLLTQIRAGQVSLPLNLLVSTYGGQPTEAVLRGMYWPGQLARTQGLDLSLAVSMENQTQPLGLASLWAGAGARYSWKGVCGCATAVSGADLHNRPHEIYRYTGLDGTGVLMKWHALTGEQPPGPPAPYNPGGDQNQFLGGYAEAWNPAFSTSRAAARCNTTAYPYGIIGAFGRGWDNLVTYDSTFSRVAQDSTTATRQVHVSNEVDFFEHFAATYPNLPAEAVSHGNEWDVACASMAEPTARVRRAVEQLRTAEALTTLVALRDSTFQPAPDSLRTKAWLALGDYWEHNFLGATSCCTTSRPEWELRLQRDVTGYVDRVQAAATAALGAQLPGAGAGGAARLFVFNPLSWPRTDYADFAYAGPAAVHIVDMTTGATVPHQLLAPAAPGAAPLLRLLADSVPSVGYRSYEVRPGAAPALPDAATWTSSPGTFESDFYRLTLTSPGGAITSLLDKTNGRVEYVAAGGTLLNPAGQPTGGTVAVENAEPVSVTLRFTVSGPQAYETRITLFRDIRRIGLATTLTNGLQNAPDVRYPFAFALPTPVTHHEELGAILTARLTTSGGHYAPQASRFDWLTLNHFVDVSAGATGRGITLSNADASFFRLGASQGSFLDETAAQLSVLVGTNDGSGIPNQYGNLTFTNRFALVPHGAAYDPATAMRAALEHQNPLTTGAITGPATGAAYPAAAFSLLRIARPDVLLWALKPAEEGIGRGVVARVWNVGAAPAPVTLDFAAPAASAMHTTHLETDQAPARLTAAGDVTDSLAQQQLRTYRVRGLAAALPLAAPVGPAPAPRVLLLPNPAHQVVRVRVAPGTPPGPVVLLDAAGRVVRTAWLAADAPGREVALPVAGLAPGVYVVRVAGRGYRLVVE